VLSGVSQWDKGNNVQVGYNVNTIYWTFGSDGQRTCPLSPYSRKVIAQREVDIGRRITNSGTACADEARVREVGIRKELSER
jgi:hypothetical protein